MGFQTKSSASDSEMSIPTPIADYRLDLEKQLQSSFYDDAPPYSPPSEKTAVTITSKPFTEWNILDEKATHRLSGIKPSPDTIVDFDGPDDPYKPINWPFRKKLFTTLVYGLMTMGSTWASSVYAPAIAQVSDEFGVSNDVGILGVSLLLLGFGMGSVCWAPLSEIYGRKPSVLAPYFIAACFSFGTATAKDIQTVLITRFFTGFFGTAPIGNTGGVLGDIWSPQQRGTAIVCYAFAVFGGATLGPIGGGAIVSSYLRWRWTSYITGIMMILSLILGVVYLDESYAPVLLVNKARRLRLETGNWALHARHEEQPISIKAVANKFLKTPFRLLATPICFLMALYASLLYGILYMCLGAIPIQFAKERGWGPVASQLPFLALFIGTIIGGCASIYNNKYYVRRFEANNNKPVPEARLPPMMLGSILFPISLIVFGLSSSRFTSPIPSLLALVLLGIGFFTIFLSAMNYLIDTFTLYAASVVAAATFLRCLFAAAFPLIVGPMFQEMGIKNASLLLGAIALLTLPIPWLFWIYGAKIRGKGRWSAEGA